MARKRIGEILLQAGVIDATSLRAALNEQKRWGGPLGRTLVNMKLVTETTLVQALSQQLNFPMVDLASVEPHPDVLDLITPDLAEQHGIIPFNLDGKFLDVAMADPTNLGIADEIRIRTQLNIRPHLAGPKAIERAVGRFYGRGMVDISIDVDTGLESGVNVINFRKNPGGERRQKRPTGASAPQGGLINQGAPPGGRPVSLPGLGDEDGISKNERDAEIKALQTRLSQLEALVSRDEDVIRKLLTLLIEKGVATREEILERIS
jgi:type IV pilus assembly protein PilB